MKKVALIEFHNAHLECLYSQIQFLNGGGYSVYGIANAKSKTSWEQMGEFQELLTISQSGLKGIKVWKLLWKIRQYLVKNDISTIIFNTAQSGYVKKFCTLPFPSHFKFLGTLHDLKKLENSGSQKVIGRKVKHYWVLNDYLVPSNAKHSVSSYYPIFFPKLPLQESISKPKNEVWICIPGQVECKRRDYVTLFKAIEKQALPSNVRFILLGKSMHANGDGAWVKRELERLKCQHQFVMWKGFVEDEVFDTYMQLCDYVLPLIHPHNTFYEGYLKYRVSGAFNQAFGYKKPLLMHVAFKTISDFQENAIFYKTHSLNQLIEDIAQQSLSIHELYTSSKWQFDVQRDKYLECL